METSCGVILVNLGSILLLQYPQGHWDLPKGHVEQDDVDNFETSRRELKEETGISELSFLENFEYRTEYQFKHKGKRRVKQVFWYIATTEEISVSLSKEHRNYMWLDWEQALEQVTHLETKQLIESAYEFMKNAGLD
ncbi:MAG: NUDIX domain-containing protein [Candidatus Thermoplasmatota archaeon]|jgi:8-oxo-dGTP pyrophosphatase MutT (NUDIX family)|nr:diadenosine tetraphosphate hydrolase [Euryarchaeota archaeon]MED5308204.1 NUDIX domain-containing protein [Candidatus Thermoplasmatota archaeon]|tara:strand:+ start:11735 stop:12145 length:411 start_codon:yes stop_codon:yes gene_type:complete